LRLRVVERAFPVDAVHLVYVPVAVVVDAIASFLLARVNVRIFVVAVLLTTIRLALDTGGAGTHIVTDAVTVLVVVVARRLRGTNGSPVDLLAFLIRIRARILRVRVAAPLSVCAEIGLVDVAGPGGEDRQRKGEKGDDEGGAALSHGVVRSYRGT
jgi:hypothetical protein